MVRVGSARKRAIFVLDPALRLIGEKDSQTLYLSYHPLTKLSSVGSCTS